MTILCLDTSGDHVVLALLKQSASPKLSAHQIIAGSRSKVRAQDLLTEVDALLHSNELKNDELTSIAVGVGPGGFTGLRVGVTMARALALILKIPLYSFSSLLAVAADAFAPHENRGESCDEIGEELRSVWVAIDAKRSEYFIQQWAYRDGEMHAQTPVKTIKHAELEQYSPVIFGEGVPSVKGVARAGALAISGAHSGDAYQVLPDYVRAPDATPPKLNLKIDALQRSDISSLVQIEARCFKTAWNEAMYASEFARPSAERIQLAARDRNLGDRLIGAAIGALIGDSWHLMNIFIDPPQQERGAAGRLLERMLVDGGERDWTLEVSDDNEAAIHLYERFGFRAVGRRPGYYADTGRDAIIMTRFFDKQDTAS